MNEPKVIYLNVGFDKDEADLKDEDFEKLIGVSWSDSRINDQDLRYELKPVCTKCNDTGRIYGLISGNGLPCDCNKQTDL